MILHLTREEAAALSMLVGAGATVLDSPLGPSLKDRFEKGLSTNFTTSDVTKVINKVGVLFQDTGTEAVVIDDE